MNGSEFFEAGLNSEIGHLSMPLIGMNTGQGPVVLPPSVAHEHSGD